MSAPTYKEDHSSQIPAMLLLANLGWDYLPPEEALELRDGSQKAVLLEPILRNWLKANNQIHFHGQTHDFSDSNIEQAIEDLRKIELVDGAQAANEEAYDKLTIPNSLEQRIGSDRKSFNLHYIDWAHPERNVYHFTAEYPVLREGRNDTYRPDIVLFVNGIPLAIIENKRPDLKTKKGEPYEQAIQQHARNQDIEDGIPRLYLYAQLLLAVDGAQGKYATAGTDGKFWAVWKEKYDSSAAESAAETELLNIKNERKPEAWDAIFQGEMGYARPYFEAQYAQPVALTGQDRLMAHLLRPERLLELAYRFIVFDGGIKKVARYQQYFAVQRALARIKQRQAGKRKGGVIWHTQGSGKSLTMVMLAKAIALEASIPNPRVIIVTDRIDLDDQITKTFKNCGKETYQAKSGAHLMKLLREGKAEIITTILDKFYKPQEENYVEDSPDVFVLVDESHRSQYGEANIRMQQVLPNACFVGFTGTPLMKKEKNTAHKYGGYIDKYTIDQAMQDGAVVPLLYEGREIPLAVNKGPLDRYFELVSRDLSDKQKADLKKRFARAKELSQADQRLYMIAYDVSDHYARNWQQTEFKAQLTAPSKLAAIRLQEHFRTIGKVDTAIVISPPDTREASDNPNTASLDEVQRFWKDLMKQYGSAKNYQDKLIEQFKKSEHPEILIVVDKLLTGFDAPRNTVLYICRSLREHNLLQAIARVNRVAKGKEYGYIIDYEGILGELDEALTSYSSLGEFEEEDLAGAVTSVLEEIEALPQVHADLWSLFREVPNKLDNEAMEQHLADDDRREEFYELQSRFARLLKMALSSLRWVQKTPQKRQDDYRRDLKYFVQLRNSVKRRYADSIDYGAYEQQIQRLIDQHVNAEEVEVRVNLVDISNKEEFDKEVERAVGTRAKADMIASRTSRHITENMDKDPAFYKKLSEMLQDIVDEMHLKWDMLSEDAKREYLNRLNEIREHALSRRENQLPDQLIDDPLSRALYHALLEQAEERPEGIALESATKEAISQLSNELFQAILRNKKVDWQKRHDVQSDMLRAMDEVLYDNRGRYHLPKLDEDAFLQHALELAKKNLS
ncbi:type I restriction endonuclease subunit R [Phaeodactylibacter xiamenensis]|uniref:type I restriction endonuclease subunit R n=1 Tax=Phaeodactylibacter xiamenensis TaxID=1524460 RepID=UPI0024A7D960|nr:HsdR family type I site-specific deoxyribonuclease [Phaeodactylibacter xiamenensis]